MGDESSRWNTGTSSRARGVPEFRVELLRRVGRRRDTLAGQIVERIFLEVSEYVATTGDEPRAQALATVKEVLGTLIGLLLEGRRIEQQERTRLREIGGQRAEQGLLLESLHGAVRVALQTAWAEVLEESARMPATVATQTALGQLALDVFEMVGDLSVALETGYLERRSKRLQRRERAQAEIIGEVLRGDFADEVEVLARAAEAGLDLNGPLALLLIAVAAPSDEDLLPRAAAAAIARRFRGAVEAGAQSDPAHVRVLLPGVDEHGWPGVAAELGRLAADERVVVLAVPPVEGPLRLKGAYRRAVERLPLVRRIFPRRHLAIEVADLDVYSLLQGAPHAERREFMHAVLGHVLDLPSAQALPLLQTLGAIFDAGGRLSPAATRLNLHVNTVKQRVRRLESLTGHHLDVAQERLRLELALHMVRMVT